MITVSLWLCGCIRTRFWPHATVLHSEMWVKSILEEASCQSKDSIISYALVCFSSFLCLSVLYWQITSEKTIMNVKPRSFQFTNSFPVYSRRGFLIKHWCYCINTVSLKQWLQDNLSFIQIEWYKPKSNRHLWNPMAADVCYTGQSLIVCSNNEQIRRALLIACRASARLIREQLNWPSLPRQAWG